MEKKEFDKLVGIDTDPKCYERIEFEMCIRDRARCLSGGRHWGWMTTRAMNIVGGVPA